MDVGRDLGAAAGERQPDRPHAGQPAARLAQLGGDGAGDVDVAAVQLDVEGGERRAGGDQGRAGGRVRQGGTVVGPQLAALHPQPQLGEAAVAEVGALGALGAGRQLAVEEDGDAEAADLLGDGERLGAGGDAVGGVEPDDRADVEGADRRVDARRRRSCRSTRSPPRRRQTSASSSGPGSAGKREDGAVVVGVGVAVEQGRRRGRRRPRARRSAPRRGPRRRWGRRAAAPLDHLDEQLAGADDRLAVDFDGRLEDHAVEVDRDLDGAADRRRGAEGDVGGAEDLLVLEDVAGEDRLSRWCRSRARRRWSRRGRGRSAAPAASRPRCRWRRSGGRRARSA